MKTGKRLCVTCFIVCAWLLPEAMSQQPDTETMRLARWMTGDFDTFAQVDRDEEEQVAYDEKTNTPYRHVRALARLRRLRIAGLENGVTLYLEQALAATRHQPYRQRIYYFTRLNGQLVTRTYRIANPQEFVGAYKNPKLLGGLKLERLTLEKGCDVVWKKVNAKLYQGRAGADKQCKSSVNGSAYVTSQVELTPAAITTLDQGFDSEGRQKWGPPAGTAGHIFVKRSN
jgi:hypothetical protein